MSGKLLECVPNYSEGRDMQKVERIADCFRGKAGVRLLDYQTDKDHNRCVITAIGEPEALRDAVIESFGKAVQLIDMTKHEGTASEDGSCGRGSVYSMQEYDASGGRRYCQGGS